MFIDEARIFVKAGPGGTGCDSYYSDLKTRHPRPDGGDGGTGGDVVFIADQGIQTLLDYRFKQHYKAGKGGHGSSKGKNGRDGEDCILRVPTGTLIKEHETGELIVDLTEHGQSVIVAAGGISGKGNARRKYTLSPGPGEERTIGLELKVIADVGIIGFPNAGKSTLISHISKVKSKVANYPFTTKQPILGFVEGDPLADDDTLEARSFVIADLPGIIEGAHEGRGLGDKFLRHAERTQILLHMIDMAGTEGRDPVADYKQIQYEIHHYGDILETKKCIIVANKMDFPEAQDNLDRFKKEFSDSVFAISAETGQGVEILVDAIRGVLCQEHSPDQSNE